jgi:hypothetical protein
MPHCKVDLRQILTTFLALVIICNLLYTASIIDFESLKRIFFHIIQTTLLIRTNNDQIIYIFFNLQDPVGFPSQHLAKLSGKEVLVLKICEEVTV